MAGYWQKIHIRANREATEVLGIGSRRQLMVKAIGAVLIIVALIFWGSDDASHDEMVARLSLLSIVFLYPAIYVRQFIGAPRKEATDQEEVFNTKLKELSNKIDRISRELLTLEEKVFLNLNIATDIMVLKNKEEDKEGIIEVYLGIFNFSAIPIKLPLRDPQAACPSTMPR